MPGPYVLPDSGGSGNPLRLVSVVLDTSSRPSYQLCEPCGYRCRLMENMSRTGICLRIVGWPEDDDGHWSGQGVPKQKEWVTQGPEKRNIRQRGSSTCTLQPQTCVSLSRSSLLVKVGRIMRTMTYTKFLLNTAIPGA